MSLINKMLQDLEARQETASVATAPAYEGLRPVRDASRSGARVLWLLVAALVLAGAAYLATNVFEFGMHTPAPVAAPPADPVASATIQAAAPAASAPLPPTASAPAAEPPQPRPAAPVSPAPAPEKTVAAAPEPKVHSNPMDAQSTRSRVETPASIVKPAAKPPVRASTRAHRPAEARTAQPKIEPNPASNGDVAVLLMDKKIRPLTAEENAEAGYRRALRLLDQGRSDDAVHELRDVLGAQPKHIKARELAAAIELQNGHWREAEKLLEEGMRQVSNHYLFARMLARVYVDHGAEAKALAVLEAAAPAGSDDAQFSSLLGSLYQRAGRAADAVKAYERAVTLEPTDGRSWLGLAIALEATSQPDAARSAYQRAQQSELSPSLARYAEQRLAALANR